MVVEVVEDNKRKSSLLKKIRAEEVKVRGEEVGRVT